jgi:hypothetical protein
MWDTCDKELRFQSLWLRRCGLGNLNSECPGLSRQDRTKSDYESLLDERVQDLIQGSWFYHWPTSSENSAEGSPWSMSRFDEAEIDAFDVQG